MLIVSHTYLLRHQLYMCWTSGSLCCCDALMLTLMKAARFNQSKESSQLNSRPHQSRVSASAALVLMWRRGENNGPQTGSVSRWRPFTCLSFLILSDSCRFPFSWNVRLYHGKSPQKVSTFDNLVRAANCRWDGLHFKADLTPPTATSFSSSLIS